MKRDPRVLLVLVTVTALSIGCASTSKKPPEAPREAKPAETASSAPRTPAPAPPKETPAPSPAPAPDVKEAPPAPTPTAVAKATPPPTATPAPKETPAPKATPAAKETPAPKATPAPKEPPAPKATPAAKETPAPKPSPTPDAEIARADTTRPPDTATPAAAGSSGSVSGKVTLLADGAPEKVLSGTVVYLPGVSRKVKAAAPTMASKGKAFTPHVIAVPLGAEVEFPNNDKIHHNAFSLSDCCKFDLGLYKDGASRKKTFDKEGVCRVYCNIHAQMSGVVVVTKGDANAVTGSGGEYTIPDLPPGKHEIVAWNERAKAEVRDTIEIVAGQAAKKDLTVDVSGFKEQPHTKKDGRPYGKDDEATY